MVSSPDYILVWNTGQYIVSVILLLLHYVIRPNGLQMCVIVFFVGLSMFLCINPVGARDLSAHQECCVCPCVHVCAFLFLSLRNSWQS